MPPNHDLVQKGKAAIALVRKGQDKGLANAAAFARECTGQSGSKIGGTDAALCSVQSQLLEELHRYFALLRSQHPGASRTSTPEDESSSATMHHRAATKAGQEVLLAFLALPALTAKGSAARAGLLQLLRDLSPRPMLFLPLLQLPACCGPVGELLLENWSGRALDEQEAANVLHLLDALLQEVSTSTSMAAALAHVAAFLASACARAPAAMAVLSGDHAPALLQSKVAAHRKLALALLCACADGCAAAAAAADVGDDDGADGNCSDQAAVAACVLHAAQCDRDATLRCAALEMACGMPAWEADSCKLARALLWSLSHDESKAVKCKALSCLRPLLQDPAAHGIPQALARAAAKHCCIAMRAASAGARLLGLAKEILLLDTVPTDARALLACCGAADAAARAAAAAVLHAELALPPRVDGSSAAAKKPRGVELLVELCCCPDLLMPLLRDALQSVSPQCADQLMDGVLWQLRSCDTGDAEDASDVKPARLRALALLSEVPSAVAKTEPWHQWLFHQLSVSLQEPSTESAAPQGGCAGGSGDDGGSSCGGSGGGDDGGSGSGGSSGGGDGGSSGGGGGGAADMAVSDDDGEPAALLAAAHEAAGHDNANSAAAETESDETQVAQQESAIAADSVAAAAAAAQDAEEVERRAARQAAAEAREAAAAALLDVFRALAAGGALTQQLCDSLEALVFPASLLRRRLLRGAVALALVLPSSGDLLLRSLAFLQDCAFGRGCVDVGRACEYVRLIGVLARERAQLLERQLRNEAKQRAKAGSADSATPVDEGEAQAAAARETEELSAEVSAALERSVAGDGLLSSYVPFLTALALAYSPKSAVHDDAAAAAAVLSAPPPPPLSAAALVSFGEFLKLSAALARRRLGAVVALALAGKAPDAVRCAAVHIWAACFARDEQGQGLYDLMEEGERSAAVRRKATRAVLSLLRQSRLKATQTHKLVRLSNDGDDAVRGAVLRFLTRLSADQPTALRTALSEMYYAPLAGSKQARVAESAARLNAATAALSLLSCSGSAGATRGRDAAAAALASVLAPRLTSAAANREEGERTAALLALLPPTQATVEAASGALSTLKRAQSNKTLQLLAVHFKNGGRPRGAWAQAPLEAVRTIAAMLTDGADSDSGNASSEGRADNATATANGGAAADSSGSGSDDSDFETTRTAVKQLRLRQGGERGAKPQNQRTEHGSYPVATAAVAAVAAAAATAAAAAAGGGGSAGDRRARGNVARPRATAAVAAAGGTRKGRGRRVQSAAADDRAGSNAQEQQQGAASRGATRGTAAAAPAAAVAAASESESEHERAVSGSKARSAAAAARDKGKSVSQRRAATSSPPCSSSGSSPEEAAVVVTGRRKKGAAAARKRQRHVLVDSSGDDSAFE